MSAVMAYGHWVVSGSWAREKPPGSSLTWGKLAASWGIATLLVALVFAGPATGVFLGGVVVALLYPLAQAAIIVGLVYAARQGSRRTL